MKRSASDSRQRQEIAVLRKANRSLTMDRQKYALRTKFAERSLMALRDEIAKLTTAVTALMGRHPPAHDDKSVYIGNCFVCGNALWHGHICPGPSSPGVTREPEGT